MAAILPAFRKFPKEGTIVGRLVVGYSDLEVGMLHCAQVVRDDLDTVLKSLYRTRGEKQRIDVADAFGRQEYKKLGLETQFSMAIGAMRHCMKIRNQFAHAVWWDANVGMLGFADLEEIAKPNDYIRDLRGLTPLFLDEPLLQAQETYFEYTDEIFTWVNYEGRRRAGKPSMPQSAAPVPPPQPALHIRPGDNKYPQLYP